MEQELSLYDVLVNHGDFDKLLETIDASEGTRAMLMEEDGPFTLFAPTDEAFDTLEEVLKSKDMSLMTVLADEELLGKILSHHVVEGTVMAADVMGMNGKSATLMDGQMAAIKVEGDKVMLGNATVIDTDIHASNGVIHVIDTVLLPDGLKL